MRSKSMSIVSQWLLLLNKELHIKNNGNNAGTATTTTTHRHPCRLHFSKARLPERLSYERRPPDWDEVRKFKLGDDFYHALSTLLSPSPSSSTSSSSSTASPLSSSLPTSSTNTSTVMDVSLKVWWFDIDDVEVTKMTRTFSSTSCQQRLRVLNLKGCNLSNYLSTFSSYLSTIGGADDDNGSDGGGSSPGKIGNGTNKVDASLFSSSLCSLVE